MIPRGKGTPTCVGLLSVVRDSGIYQVGFHIKFNVKATRGPSRNASIYVLVVSTCTHYGGRRVLVEHESCMSLDHTVTLALYSIAVSRLRENIIEL